MDVEEARALARQAHQGQVDKAGRPYHEHVEAVADLLAEHGPDAQIAGLLHDVIEDTGLTADDLRAAGVSKHVVDAVLSVTRRKGETYMDMIRRAAAHPLGRLVKLADNAHNSSPERLAVLGDEEAAFLAKRYTRARKALSDPVGDEIEGERDMSQQRVDDDWCNCQALEDTPQWPGPWHPRGDQPFYPCAQADQPADEGNET